MLNGLAGFGGYGLGVRVQDLGFEVVRERSPEERCQPRQKSREERLKAKVEPPLT